ncbi:MAG: hypothetical protein P8X88_06610 [Gammaproteobacteria bacterium]
MPARFIIHSVVTLILFAIGWWLYMRLLGGYKGEIDSVGVAIYWFAILVYVLFSWLFYWFVNKLKLRAWVIAQIIAIAIAVVSTGSLLYISNEHQKQLEEKAMLEQQEEKSSIQELEQSDSKVENKIQSLNISEDK